MNDDQKCDGKCHEKNTMDIFHEHWHRPGPQCNTMCLKRCQGCKQPWLTVYDLSIEIQEAFDKGLHSKVLCDQCHELKIMCKCRDKE